MKHLFPRFLVAIPLVVGLAVVACNDDDNATMPSAPRVPAATATPTPSPAPIAAMTPTPGTPTTGERVGFLGHIRAISGTRMTISNFTVITNGDTQFFRNGQAASFSDFSVGEDARVAGEMLGDGSVLAIRVSLLPAS
jgi:hypothetical protein